MSPNTAPPERGKPARVYSSSPSSLHGDGDKSSPTAWCSSDDDLIYRPAVKRATAAALWDSSDDDSLPSDPGEPTLKRRRELEAQRVLAKNASSTKRSFQSRASLLNLGKGKAPSVQMETSKLKRAANRYDQVRDCIPSFPITSQQNPIDLTRSDSEEENGLPEPPTLLTAPVIPSQGSRLPRKRRRARHAKKTINAGVTEERMRAAAKRLADSLERGRLDQDAGTRSTSPSSPGSGDKTFDEEFPTTVQKQGTESSLPPRHSTDRGSLRAYLVSTPGMPPTHTPSRQATTSAFASPVATVHPALPTRSATVPSHVEKAAVEPRERLPSASGSRQENDTSKNSSALVNTTPTRLPSNLEKNTSYSTSIEANPAHVDGVEPDNEPPQIIEPITQPSDRYDPPIDAGPSSSSSVTVHLAINLTTNTTNEQPVHDRLYVQGPSQSEGGGALISEVSTKPVAAGVGGVDESPPVDKSPPVDTPNTVRPTHNEGGASPLNSALPALSLDDQYPLVSSPTISLTKEAPPVVDAISSIPGHKSPAFPIPPSESSSHFLLTSLLGGLSPRSWKAQRLAQKLMERQQAIPRKAEQGQAAQAAVILADLEAKDKNAFRELEDGTESDVSGFLDRAVDSCHSPIELGTFSNTDGFTSEYVYNASTSVALPRSAQRFDTSLHDMINRVPENQRNYHLLKTIFEAYVAERTYLDEPDADEIEIVNTVDAEPKPPPFEFQYSNQIHYSADVGEPLPSQGCSCIGPCDPLSNTCKCALRQTLYLYGTATKGFAYYDGKLRHLNNISIWECSDACGCPPECGNRVIQRGRSRSTNIEIFKTLNKGWGVRTGSVIMPGTFVGVYAGEIIREAESEVRAHVYNKAGRTYLFDLDGYQIRNPPAGLEKVDPQTAELAYAAQKDALAWALEVAEEGETPSTAGYSTHSVDAFHWGFSRFFNHSCDPNLITVQAYVKDFHPERPILAVFARRKIVPGEELCISYHGLEDDDEADDEPLSSKPTKSRSQNAHVVAPKDNRSRASEAERQLQINDGCQCGTKKCTGYLFNIHMQG